MHWVLTRGRVPVFVTVAVLTLVSAWFASSLDVEMANESLVADDAIGARGYASFRVTFGSDEDLILAVRHPALLEASGIAWLSRLTARLERVEGVRAVFSLANAMQLVTPDLGAAMAPLSPDEIADEDAGAALVAALDRNPDLMGWLISEDRRTAGIVIELEDHPDDVEAPSRTISDVRALMADERRPGQTLWLTGIAVQKNDVSAYTQRDQRVLVPLSFATLALVLFVFVRSWPLVALPLAVTAVSVSWTMGAYAGSGYRTNAITALLPPVVMVLSVSVSVHLISRWETLRGGEAPERILRAVRSVFFPCLLCSVTTAASFASLLLSDVPAVRQFGAFSGLGAMAALVAGLTIVPIGLLYCRARKDFASSRTHGAIARVLNGSAYVAVEYPRWVLAIAGLLTLVAGVAAIGIRNNTDLVRFLKPSAPLYRDTMAIDENLMGTQATEFVVSRRDGLPLTGAADLSRLAAFEAAARSRVEVSEVFSVLPILRQIHRAATGGLHLALPERQEEVDRVLDFVEAADDRRLIDKWLAPEMDQARFTVRTRSLGTADASTLSEALESTAGTVFGADYDVVRTGSFDRVARDSNRLVGAQARSFAVAMVLVFLCVGLVFRSPRLTLLSLLPNCVPVVWTVGLMGAVGIDLSTGTAMIAPAVIGLVVDDTIHYLTGFHRELGHGPAAAVRRTTTKVGRALLVNSVVLACGFWVGCFGSFVPTIYFSLLTGLTMAGALVCDLLLTPATLLVFGGYDRRDGSAG